MLARVAVTPPGPAKRRIVNTWWVAAGGGSLWVVNPNYDRVTRVDAVTAKVVASVPVPVEIPFGVVVRNGVPWVAGAGKVLRIDPAKNRADGVITLSRASAPIFTQVSNGDAGSGQPTTTPACSTTCTSRRESRLRVRSESRLARCSPPQSYPHPPIRAYLFETCPVPGTGHVRSGGGTAETAGFGPICPCPLSAPVPGTGRERGEHGRL